MQKRPTHDERERAVIDCVESQFPNFAGNTSPWNKIPDGQDPPDFISENPRARIGLELREWLDGDQMGKDRKSTRLNSSHLVISYAVFCLKKKKNTRRTRHPTLALSPDHR